MVEDGAAILDLGAESTRPGARTVPLEEELARLLPVLGGLRRATDAVLSVDTRKAAVARAALELGADWINDVSGLRHDPALAGAVAEAGAGLVLMHSRGEPATMQRDPGYGDCLAEVAAELLASVDAARAAGVAADRLLLDPGIGFGKRHEDNLALLHGLPTLRALGHPVLLGLSRKAVTARLLDERDPPPPSERDQATLALTAWCHGMGVSVHRVHRPGYAVQALRVLRGTGSGFPQASSTAAGDEPT
ncbi:MAG: dihydropteroate synthase [Planctomycetota bacterium]